jgi:hypothetical protein
MEEVLASLLLAVVRAAALTVAPTPGDNCPASAQVLAALQTHAPALVAPRLSDDPAKVLTLNLMPALATGETSFSLLDKTGLVKLYRTLPPPAGDRARDCAALADSVAFIVVRYFEELEMPALPERKPEPRPPPPKASPPPPPKPVAPEPAAAGLPAKLALSVNGGRRFPGEAVNLGGYEAKLVVGAALTTLGQGGGDLWLDAGAGFAGHASYAWGQAESESATSDRLAAELALLAGWRRQRSRLHAGPLACIEIIWLDASPGGHAQNETRVGAAAGIKIGYQYFAPGRLFVRADVAGNLALVRQEVMTRSGSTVFSAPRTYLTLTVGVGIWL